MSTNVIEFPAPDDTATKLRESLDVQKAALEVVAHDEAIRELCDARDDLKSFIRNKMKRAGVQSLRTKGVVAAFRKSFEPFCKCHDKHLVLCETALIAGSIVEAYLVECEPWLKVTALATEVTA